MVRGIYTGASGMNAEQAKLDVIANNLANVDKPAFKRDTVSFKAFPEMRMARTDDDGVVILPLGSTDIRPYIGTMGTGVEVNEVYTEWAQGSLKATENMLDLSLDGKGFFAVETPKGERYTRNGSFILDKEMYMVTKEGYRVLGENGYIQLKHNNFMIDENGGVSVNGNFQDDPGRPVQMMENDWQGAELIDTLKIVNFENDRYLKKEANSLWIDTEVSGKANIVKIGDGRPKVVSGFLEMSNVNPISEMVRMIEVQRAYELNSKVITTADALVGRAVTEVGRVM